MVAFHTIKPGDTLYDVHSHRMGNTSMRTMGTWTVKIHEVHENYVIASWNSNPPKHFGRRWAEKLRRSPYKPKSPKPSVFS